VERHDRAGFDTYLLIRLVASAEPYYAEVSPSVFARALMLGTPGTVTKAVKRLADRKLIEQQPGRQPFVRVLREDGSGDPYTPPWQQSEAYFQLPSSYWTAPEQWHHALNLPEKAMLLIALSLTDQFVFPYDRAPAWYGLSPSTAERGLLGLRHRGLLKAQTRFKDAPLAPRGYTEQLVYTVSNAFGAKRRHNRETAAPAPFEEEVVA
jgi:hypothetical protein